MDIQLKLNQKEICAGKKLSVKIGIGVGEVKVLFVGGQINRCEYLIVGESMRQACEAETHALEGGQTLVSEDVYSYIEKYYKMEESHGAVDHGPSENNMKFYMVIKSTGDRLPIKADAYLMRSHFNSDRLREKLKSLRQFVPAAITIYLDIEKELWSKEIRMLTMMFLNLKVDLSQTRNEQGMNRIQEIVRTVQRCVYRTRGSLNKFLMDDKGSVMLIVWGLPPFSNPDDHTRGVQSALSLVKELKKHNCGAYMGITTGSCFTGVCGAHGGRREYSLLGEIVNLAARFMQQAIYHAKKQQEEKKLKTDYVVLICDKTKDLIQNKINSEYVLRANLKGFSNEFYFYEPKYDLKPPTKSSVYFLPDVKTHKHNILLGKQDPSSTNITADMMSSKALFMAGRRDNIYDMLNDLNRVFKEESNEYILVRGTMGSGKSLFIRKSLFEFVEMNKEIKQQL
jgi:class 3 adenylate cyclase